MKGRLITIEGIDGSGKNTQAELLVEKLNHCKRMAKLYSFPSYEETFFGKEIGLYLNGQFGTIDQVHPKLASLLFAGDRFEKKQNIVDDLNCGIDVVCDRYVESNIAHQCAKLPVSERPSFIAWLEYLEYCIYKLPKPEVTFFLDVPLSISKDLVLRKKQRVYTKEKEDIHESAYQYMLNVYRVYQMLRHERKWIAMQCMEGNKLKSIETISCELLQEIHKI